MNMLEEHISYDPNQRIISYKGNKVVDLTGVPEEPRATIYSKVDFDADGIQTTLSFNDSRRPFDFKFFHLSPIGLISAIVENRLEIDGMTVNGALQEAYEHTKHAITIST